MKELKIVYAGDRDISVYVLKHILDSGVMPQALLISDYDRATHAQELQHMCSYLDHNQILVGKEFHSESGFHTLTKLEPDYIICVHFPYIIPQAILQLPKFGVLNLHPAYLPYNRGWHTPTWALLENTPIGATLHFMDEGIDTGDIIHQRQLIPASHDTAHSLYDKVKQLEFTVFKEVWTDLINGTFTRTPQQPNDGTSHKRKELFKPEIQEIDLDTLQSPRELLRRLRALTTNNLSEAAYFQSDGKIYRIQISITEDSPTH